MSGIYIPGVEKPKSQEQCKFFDYAPFRADYCVLFSTCKGINACPIVAVPDHGRLIDADAFEKFVHDKWEDYDHWLLNYIEARPTIIPADKYDVNN